MTTTMRDVVFLGIGVWAPVDEGRIGAPREERTRLWPLALMIRWANGEWGFPGAASGSADVLVSAQKQIDEIEHWADLAGVEQRVDFEGHNRQHFVMLEPCVGACVDLSKTNRMAQRLARCFGGADAMWVYLAERSGEPCLPSILASGRLAPCAREQLEAMCRRMSRSRPASAAPIEWPADPPASTVDPAPEQEPAKVRSAVHALLALLPTGRAAERADAARAAVIETLLADALQASDGNRTRSAEVLGTTDELVCQWLHRYPRLAEEFPGRRGRPRSRNGG